MRAWRRTLRAPGTGLRLQCTLLLLHSGVGNVPAFAQWPMLSQGWTEPSSGRVERGRLLGSGVPEADL